MPLFVSCRRYGKACRRLRTLRLSVCGFFGMFDGLRSREFVRVRVVRLGKILPNQEMRVRERARVAKIENKLDEVIVIFPDETVERF